MNYLIRGALIAATMIPVAAQAGETTRASFGALPDGRKVEAITLSNQHGVRATIITYGAILQALSAPDRNGKSEDVTLGYTDMKGYLVAPNYFGATVGRYANRIKGGTFAIDGKTYTLAKNNGPNALHGGPKGFDKQLWTVEKVTSGENASVTLRYVSADGEEGYPGQLTVTATYALNEKNELSVEYTATTTKPTIVNITNHSFFNLAGEASQRSIYDHVVTIPAETTTPVDATLIPNGQLRPVEGTPFDFRKPMAIGARIRDGRDPQIVFGQGYDENFVIAKAPAAQPTLHARVEDPSSGRVMEILSNQPGVQFYTGNFLDGTAIGKSNHAYRQGDGLALEPQLFPDTPNQPAFGSARLNPGQTYRNVIVYRFSTTN
ncbi:aldose epimerase family protein [Sphingomonas sp. HT-1]|uniref:aldose epimerase family protein n=1 Tax=unclassified Sphingomonas TaxID=196159 RepID=UPI0002D67089|nr:MULTISPECIES: aldose epimerase family protein [unclassified Sphingomonas]KTF69877.1 galactose mutarotase [Sphingomonas sp. WG]